MTALFDGMRSLSEELRRAAGDLEVSLYGVADAKGFLSPEYQGNRPQDVMPSVRSVVVLGVPLLRGSMDALPKGRAEYHNSLLAATVTLRYTSFQLAKRIEDAEYLASIVPAEGSEFGIWYADRETLRADVSLRYAAYLAGLGRYGLNHSLVTEKYGPRVRFMGVLTDAPLEPGVPASDFAHEGCSSCGRCVDICPVGALEKDGTIHREKCAQYMFGELGGLRCGLCLKTCPL